MIGTKKTTMCNFSYKNIGSTPNTNEMKTILKPKLPYLYSKLLEACALFGCSHISGYIQLSLLPSMYIIIRFVHILPLISWG